MKADISIKGDKMSSEAWEDRTCNYLYAAASEFASVGPSVSQQLMQRLRQRTRGKPRYEDALTKAAKMKHPCCGKCSRILISSINCTINPSKSTRPRNQRKSEQETRATMTCRCTCGTVQKVYEPRKGALSGRQSNDNFLLIQPSPPPLQQSGMKRASLYAHVGNKPPRKKKKGNKAGDVEKKTDQDQGHAERECARLIPVQRGSMDQRASHDDDHINGDAFSHTSQCPVSAANVSFFSPKMPRTQEDKTTVFKKSEFMHHPPDGGRGNTQPHDITMVEMKRERDVVRGSGAPQLVENRGTGKKEDAMPSSKAVKQEEGCHIPPLRTLANMGGGKRKKNKLALAESSKALGSGCERTTQQKGASRGLQEGWPERLREEASGSKSAPIFADTTVDSSSCSKTLNAPQKTGVKTHGGPLHQPAQGFKTTLQLAQERGEMQGKEEKPIMRTLEIVPMGKRQKKKKLREEAAQAAHARDGGGFSLQPHIRQGMQRGGSSSELRKEDNVVFITGDKNTSFVNAREQKSELCLTSAAGNGLRTLEPQQRNAKRKDEKSVSLAPAQASSSSSFPAASAAAATAAAPSTGLRTLDLEPPTNPKKNKKKKKKDKSAAAAAAEGEKKTTEDKFQALRDLLK